MDVALRSGDWLHVTVVEGDPGDGLAVLKDFLERIDPAVLDTAVSAVLQVESGSYAELCLRVLRGWASGEVRFGTH